MLLKKNLKISEISILTYSRNPSQRILHCRLQKQSYSLPNKEYTKHIPGTGVVGDVYFQKSISVSKSAALH